MTCYCGTTFLTALSAVTPTTSPTHAGPATLSPTPLIAFSLNSVGRSTPTALSTARALNTKITTLT